VLLVVLLLHNELGDSSIEKLIHKFCFHLVRKKLCPKSGTGFLVQVFGTGFWCVCHWHKTTNTSHDTTVYNKSFFLQIKASEKVH